MNILGFGLAICVAAYACIFNVCYCAIVAGCEVHDEPRHAGSGKARSYQSAAGILGQAGRKPPKCFWRCWSGFRQVHACCTHCVLNVFCTSHQTYMSSTRFDRWCALATLFDRLREGLEASDDGADRFAVYPGASAGRTSSPPR